MFEGDSAAIYNSFVAGDRPVHEHLCSLVEQQYEASDGTGPFTVLSIGDGCGDPSLLVAEKLKARVLANESNQRRAVVYSTDPCAGMQEQALKRALGGDGSLAGSLDHGDEDPPLSLYILPLAADSRADFQRMFPRPETVDMVLLSFSLMFVPDRQTCLAEVARVLKPGGRVAIVVLRNFGMMTVIEQAFKQVISQVMSVGPLHGLDSVEDAWNRAFPTRPPGNSGTRHGLAACLALSDEGSVEGLLQMLMEQSPAVVLKPVSHHCHLFDYALELAKLKERQIVLGMFSILVEEDGWRRLGGLIGELDEGKVRTRVEEAIWTQIRHCHSWAPVADPASEEQSSENRKMRCSNYKPYLVVAEKGPL
jgi:SAM-dependent methyltransferase